MQQLSEKSLDLVRSTARWSYEALDADEPRSLATIGAKVRESLEGYDIGFHLYASTQAHLTKHCADGKARAVMINDLKHYLRAQ